MNRVDLGYQARWETLKVIIGESREKTDEKSELREAFNVVLQAMKMLEQAEKPCLSRPIVPYPSPMSGDPRAVFDPLTGNLELPGKKKELP